MLTSIRRFAAAALFALALYQSQIYQKPHSSLPVPLKDETIGERVSVSERDSVSDPHHDENCGLLLPILEIAMKLMKEVDMHTVLSSLSAANNIVSIIRAYRKKVYGQLLWTVGCGERVVLPGAPISIKDEKWEGARKMVAGRFVNVYSSNDWMLGIAVRASDTCLGNFLELTPKYRICGIQPIDSLGIENVDVTELIRGHSSYLWMTNQILEQLDLESYYPVFGTTRAKPQ